MSKQIKELRSALRSNKQLCARVQELTEVNGDLTAQLIAAKEQLHSLKADGESAVNELNTEMTRITERLMKVSGELHLVQSGPSGTPNVIVGGLSGCARCGGDHENLRFREMARPFRNLTHWTHCPTNGDPIMMRIVDEDHSE